MARSNLPFVSSNIPPDLRQFLDRVRESLDGNTYVRRTDYIYGTVPRLPGEPPGGGGGGGGDGGGGTLPCGNPVTPTAPTGFEVAAGFSGFLLSWQMPAYCGHDHTEVYALRRNGGASELSEVNRIGDSRGVMYSHVVNQADDYWCFWIRHVNTTGVKGPFNDTLGTCARTAIPPEILIDALKGRITESQLYKHLGDRIDLVDGPIELDGSVNNRVAAEALARETGIYNETISRTNADEALSTRIDVVVAKADGNAAAIASEATARANADGALGTRIDVVVAQANTNAAAIVSEATARANADGALGTRIDQVQAVGNNNSALITNINTSQIGYCTKNGATTADKDRTACEVNGGTWNVGLPWATAVKQVSVTYNGQSVALEQQFNAIASDVNGLEAQYTVKIDNNGYVSGFGLASTPVNGVPFSDFIIRADRFSIAAPANPDAGYQNDPSIPFIVTTTGQTIDGIYVPPGTYIKAAYIQNGTITNAKIANATIDSAKIISLSVDKLTTGSLAIGQCISSQGFVSGSSGWRICADGNAEFNNLVARGTMRSDNWNGSLNNGVISANGTRGWVIDKNGNAEFDTVHLRRGAVSSMKFVPVEGDSALPQKNIAYPSNVTQWSLNTPYSVGQRVWYGDQLTVYRCKLAHTSSVARLPTNVTYWELLDYFVDLANITIDASVFANAATELGAAFFGRFVAAASVRYSLGNPLTRLTTRDLSVRLIRRNLNSTTTLFAEGGFALPYCGITTAKSDPSYPNEYDYFYSAPITSFEYVGTTPGTFVLQAKSLIATSLVTIIASDISFGYIGTKR